MEIILPCLTLDISSLYWRFFAEAKIATYSRRLRLATCSVLTALPMDTTYPSSTQTQGVHVT